MIADHFITDLLHHRLAAWLIIAMASCSPAFSAEEALITLMLGKDVGVSYPRKIDTTTLKGLASTTGYPLEWSGLTRTNGQVIRLPSGLSRQEVERVARVIATVNGVLWAEATSPDNARIASPPPDLATGQGRATSSPTRATITQLTIKLRNSGAHEDHELSPETVRELSRAIGVSLKPQSRLADGGWIFRLPVPVNSLQARQMEMSLEAMPVVVYADALKTKSARSVAMPNDPRLPAMWFMKEPDSFAGAANIQQAWHLGTGSRDITIAVLDSGILFRPTHPDLADNLVYLNDKQTIIAGWDMISRVWQARDGNRRDSNPRDQGDWVNSQTRQAHRDDCDQTAPSSWHGSHVAGTIAASTNNGIGISGVSWQASLIPVRVLGACFGEDADIIDGIYWAAGSRDVSGSSATGYPAKIINLSLGGEGECSNSYQAAIDYALLQGAVVVVAAGNESMNVSRSSPANCNGVIAVSAVNRDGELASYSNYGSGITVAAPGGGFDSTDDDGILSTINRSRTKPAPRGMGYATEHGTSMAAPIVSGIISLMLSADTQNRLIAAKIKEILHRSARPFPLQSNCQTTLEGQCGGGLVDAFLAVKAVQELQ
ncbi:MAG: S8 family peptidase [Methylococcaceae bacterium]|jgi:serine protease